MDITKIIKAFCGTGAAYGSLLAPLLVPVCCSVLLCSCFLPILNAPLGFWNNSNTAPELRDSNKAAITACAIYYPFAVMVCYFMLMKACKDPEQLASLASSFK